MSKPAPFSALLEALIADKGWQGRAELHKVFIFRNDLVGPDIARQVQPHLIC